MPEQNAFGTLLKINLSQLYAVFRCARQYDNLEGILDKIKDTSRLAYYSILDKGIKSLDFKTFSLQQEQLGVFTTFCTHLDKNKKLGFFKFNEHLNRIKIGAKELGIKNKIEKKEETNIKQIVFETCKQHFKLFNQKQKVRIILRANTKIELTIEPYEKAQEEIHLISYQAKRELAQIKHTDLSISLKANQKLKHNQEALLIDEDGNVLEGAWSNIFIIKNKKIFTPKNILLESKQSNFFLPTFTFVLRSL